MQHRLSLLQYKLQIGILLALLIAVIIVNNLSSKKNLEHMDVSVSSIYKDRLLASSYLFELTNHLYEKKLLFATRQPEVVRRANDRAILGLIGRYERTMFTKQEAVYWRSFKAGLLQYDASLEAGNPAPQIFERVLHDLKSLTHVQVTEGEHLFRGTRSDINASARGYYLELFLAIIIGVIVLGLIGVSRNTLTPFRQHPSLN